MSKPPSTIRTMKAMQLARRDAERKDWLTALQVLQYSGIPSKEAAFWLWTWAFALDEADKQQKGNTR